MALIEATSLGDLVLHAADRWPESHITFDKSSRSYAEMANGATEVAKGLIGLGLPAGTHVGILLPNSFDLMNAIFGTALAGCVPVLLNARYRSDELAWVVDNADISLLISTTGKAEGVDFAARLLEAFPDIQGQAADSLSLTSAPDLKRIVLLDGAHPSCLDRAAFLDKAQAASEMAFQERRAAVHLSDTGIMMYTSGTTARPKGCPISHEAFTRNCFYGGAERLLLSPEQTLWTPLPLYHMGALMPYGGCLATGANFVGQSHFDPGLGLQQMEDHQVTLCFSAFAMITTALINHPDFDEGKLGALARIHNVAPPDMLKQYEAAFPGRVQTSGYGITETSGVTCIDHPDRPYEERLTTCGHAFPGVTLKIFDPETDAELPTGEVGELRIHGYAVIKEYFKAPDKTAETLAGGWLHTGDACSLTESGALRFHGRLKDMLRVGGENVAALEIEALLARHPAVQLAQVIGIPDARLEEVPAAFVELVEGQDATEEELIAFCAEKIASFKVPRHIRTVTSWPMSASKVKKGDLRDQLIAELGL